MKLTDKQALQEWEQYLQSIREETAIDRAMPVAEREKRRQWLEAHPAQNGSKSCSHSPPHVPGQIRRRPQPPPTISTRMKNAAILK